MLNQLINNQYLRTLAVFVILFALTRLGASILERAVLRLVSKTKTDLDDIIIKKSSKPISILLLLIALRISINEIAIIDSTQTMIHDMIYSLIVIVAAYIVYVITDVLIVELWKGFSQKADLKTGESLTAIINGFVKIILILLSLVYILHIWDVEIVPILGALGIAGLAVALALQPTLSNIFSGISIILDKSISVGDLIYLDNETKGTIEKIGLRSTRIKTFDNELLIIPNNKLAEGKIQNVALPEPKSRVVIKFSVAYGSEIEKVKKIVLKEINSIKNISKDPLPLVRFIEMTSSSLDFKVYFYVDSYQHRFDAIDEANTKIYNALNKNKIRIPFPQMDVHLKKN